MVDVSETIQGDTLFVDAATSSGHAAELVCKLNGASIATACNRGTSTSPIYRTVIPFP